MANTVGIISGDTKQLLITITDAAGSLVDVSDAASIVYGIFEQNGTSVIIKTLADGITVDGAVVTVLIDPADTAPLAGSFLHEMQIITAAGDVATVLQGTVQIIRDLIEEPAG